MSKRRYGRIEVEISNEDKVLFPQAGITKGDLIGYYERIADLILPHLEDRPLVLQRFPNGLDGEGFYQKQAGDYFPSWISTVEVDVKTKDERQQLVVCDSKAALVYLANQATISLHPWLCRRDKIAHPDQMIFDLDPPGDDFEMARLAALRIREVLDELDLPSFPKLSGSRGVHIVVPLKREETFDEVRAFARSTMQVLAARHPEQFTMEQRKDKRGKRLYLDVGRNAYAQTAVAPWSVRPLPEAPIAAPVSWRDLERKGIGPRDYTIHNVFRRIARRQDPWGSLRRHAHSLDGARRRLEKVRQEK